MTPEQVAAARRLLGWARERLAAESAVTIHTVVMFETNRSGPSTTPQRISSIREALEAAGIEFTDGDAPGVRLHGRTETP